MAANIQLPGFDDASPVRQNTAIRQIADQLPGLAPLASPVFTGDPQAPTPATADNDTSIATTAYVKANLATYAPLASPALTGNPTAPTASPGDNDTSIATTAFVTGALGGYVVTSRAVNTGTGLSGGGNLTADRTISLANTSVSPGSYTLASITVDAQGRLTAASNGAPSTINLSKTANQTRTSNTAFTDITDLTFSIGANETYQFIAHLFVDTGGGGIKTAVNGPAGLSRLRAITTGGVYVTAYDTNISATGAVGVLGLIQMFGVVTNGATAGTFALRFAQNTSNATGCIVEQRSWLEYRLIT